MALKILRFGRVMCSQSFFSSFSCSSASDCCGSIWDRPKRVSRHCSCRSIRCWSIRRPRRKTCRPLPWSPPASIFTRGSRSGRIRDYLGAGLASGAAMSFRQNLPPVLIFTFLVCEVLRLWKRRHMLTVPPPRRQRKTIEQGNPRESLAMLVGKEAALFLLPLTVFFALPMIMFPRMGVSTILGSRHAVTGHGRACENFRAMVRGR